MKNFESVFHPDGTDTSGRPRFRIAGSGVRRWPQSAANTAAIIRVIEGRAIAVKSRSLGSPGNADSYHIETPFLDGGLFAMTGNYLLGKRGAWIHGERAVTWLAQQLGLRPPGSLRQNNPPILPDDLLAAFMATNFVVQVQPEIELQIGREAPGELASMLEHRQAEIAAIVTAFNPFSTQLADEVNRLRNLYLEHHLASGGLSFLPAEGRDPTGRWAAEPSLLVFDPTPDQVEALLTHFQQHAIVVASRDEISLRKHKAHRT
jgi:hypothetical protein